jgi:hypothetical protein
VQGVGGDEGSTHTPVNFPLSKVETQAFRRGFARQKVEPHLDFGNLDRQVDREYLCMAAIGARAPIAKIVWIFARVNSTVSATHGPPKWVAQLP